MFGQEIEFDSVHHSLFCHALLILSFMEAEQRPINKLVSGKKMCFGIATW